MIHSGIGAIHSIGDSEYLVSADPDPDDIIGDGDWFSSVLQAGQGVYRDYLQSKAAKKGYMVNFMPNQPAISTGQNGPNTLTAAAPKANPLPLVAMLGAAALLVMRR